MDTGGTPIEQIRQINEFSRNPYDYPQTSRDPQETQPSYDPRVDPRRNVEDIPELDEEEIISQPEKKQPVGIMSHVRESFREPLLIIIIYVLLSLDIVRNGIGYYIPIIKPSQAGDISMIAYIVYGLILAITFVFAKKLLL